MIKWGPRVRPSSYGDVLSATAAADTTVISDFIASRLPRLQEQGLPATATAIATPHLVARALAAPVARTQAAAELQIQLRQKAADASSRYKPFPYLERFVKPDAHAYAYPAAARAWQLLAQLGWLSHLPPGSVINVHPHDLCPHLLIPILPP